LKNALIPFRGSLPSYSLHQVGSGKLTYDVNGNLTSGGGNAYT